MSGPRRILQIVEALAFPRFTGTDGERRAADDVAERFARLGLAVRREPFRVGRDAIRLYQRALFGASAALVLLVGACAARAPLAGALCAAAQLALLARSSRWTPRIEPLFDRGEQLDSQNVIARREGSGPAGIHVVVLAHLDSKSSRLPTSVTVTSLLLALGVTIALGGWALLAAARVAEPPPAGPALAASIAAAAALLAVAILQRSGNESPGAMDNASGLAVLVESAGALAADPALASADLTFVATGAEEIGLGGAMRWIQAHAAEYPRERTVVLNVDSVGVGRGLLAAGVAGRAPSGLAMPRLLERGARRARVRARALPFLLGAGVDTMPIAARGYATATVLGQVLGAASSRMHSARDTVDHLDEAALREAAALVHALAIEAAGP
jgi:hypothetical protein